MISEECCTWFECFGLLTNIRRRRVLCANTKSDDEIIIYVCRNHVKLPRGIYSRQELLVELAGWKGQWGDRYCGLLTLSRTVWSRPVQPLHWTNWKLIFTTILLPWRRSSVWTWSHSRPYSGTPWPACSGSSRTPAGRSHRSSWWQTRASVSGTFCSEGSPSAKMRDIRGRKDRKKVLNVFFSNKTSKPIQNELKIQTLLLTRPKCKCMLLQDSGTDPVVDGWLWVAVLEVERVHHQGLGQLVSVGHPERRKHFGIIINRQFD